ncbi:MAG: hypothetical protein LM580_01295 [Thermofilum sp.]|nr:hypothetical protein [Thermofilum sp.]
MRLLDLISGLLRRGGGEWLERALPEEEPYTLPPAALELAGAPVHVLARDPELVLGAELAVGILRETFRREALAGLRALVLFDSRSIDRALREARERCDATVTRAMERAREDYREQLKWARRLWGGRELSYFGVYDSENAVAIAGVHPRAGFGNWIYTVSHELLHHAFRRCPGRGENLKPLAEALLETCPSLRERFSAEELAGDEVAAHFLEEEALGFIAHRYFKEGAREPGPAERRLSLAELCFRLRVGERAYWKLLPKILERRALEPVSDGPLRRAAHALFLQWIQRFPADVYAERLAELADAYAKVLRDLAEEATQRLRWLAEHKPEPDLVFSAERKLGELRRLTSFIE